MSILNDFLTNNLQDLPNDTQNIPAGLLPDYTAHHKHHRKTRETCLPCRQKNAKDFLSGNTPGVMAFYAPEEQRNAALIKSQHPSPHPANLNANTRPDNLTVEDDETVQRLVAWREESSY